MLRSESLILPAQSKFFKEVRPCTSSEVRLLFLQSSNSKSGKPCTLSAVNLLLSKVSPAQNSAVMFPLRITVVPVACSTVSVSLLSAVSVQPSTVMGEEPPSVVTTLILISRLSGLRVSTARCESPVPPPEPPPCPGAGFAARICSTVGSVTFFIFNVTLPGCSHVNSVPLNVTLKLITILMYGIPQFPGILKIPLCWACSEGYPDPFSAWYTFPWSKQ